MTITSKSKRLTRAQKKFYVGASVLVVAIGYLIFTGVQVSSSYYYTVSEVVSMGNKVQGASLRLEGKVSPGSIQADHGNLNLEFDIFDDSEKSMPVVYKGIIPDLFQENLDVVVEGTVGQDGKFHADRLLTSCPSKYEAAAQDTSPN
ncbi:MAG TPA: cytochrome c maturation protein CcmE [Nitrospinota bacterium]|nr:cytochrome c maturation protein CcmE [Nitrospinota bacterium]